MEVQFVAGEPARCRSTCLGTRFIAISQSQRLYSNRTGVRKRPRRFTPVFPPSPTPLVCHSQHEYAIATPNELRSCRGFLSLPASGHWRGFYRLPAQDEPPVEKVSRATAAEHRFSDEEIEFFEERVRPLLVKRCHECHVDKTEPEGGLRLDSRERLLKGGDTGPAIVPGKPKSSLLINAINHGELFQMPPKTKLLAEEIATLTKWVEMGAPWPPEQPTATDELRKIIRPPRAQSGALGVAGDKRQSRRQLRMTRGPQTALIASSLRGWKTRE